MTVGSRSSITPRREDVLVVVRAEVLRDRARVIRLVEAPLVEADRERLHRLRRPLLDHHRDDRARVDAAAEERAERHVADKPTPHGRLGGVRETPRRTPRRTCPRPPATRQVPVALDASTGPSRQRGRWPAGSLRTPPKIDRGAARTRARGSAPARPRVELARARRVLEQAPSARSRRAASADRRRSRAASCRAGRARAAARCRARPRARSANMPSSCSTQSRPALLVEVDDHLGVASRSRSTWPAPRARARSSRKL